MSAVEPSPKLPKQQLLTLFETISGVQVRWNTGQRPLLGQRPGTEKAWLLVGLQGWRELGTDELRVKYNPETNSNDEMLIGQRTFTAALQAFSLDPELDAYDLLERVRFRVRTQAARALMVPILALRDFQQILVLPPDQAATVGGHIVLRATMDVRMNCVIGASPNDPGGGGIIETAPVPVPVIGGNLLP